MDPWGCCTSLCVILSGGTYFGVVEEPLEIRILGECGLHTFYGLRDIPFGHGDDLDRHGGGDSITTGSADGLG